MSEPVTNEVLRELRGRKYLSHSLLHPLDEALMDRAAVEIELLLHFVAKHPCECYEEYGKPFTACERCQLLGKGR